MSPGPVDRLERAEQRDLDVQLFELGRRDRRETRIGRPGGDRAARHDGAERLVRLDVADAATQLAAVVQRHERAARLLQHGGLAGHVRRRNADVRRERFARELQQQLAIVVGRHAGENRRVNAELAERAEKFLAFFSAVSAASAFDLLVHILQSGAHARSPRSKVPNAAAR